MGIIQVLKDQHSSTAEPQTLHGQCFHYKGHKPTRSIDWNPNSDSRFESVQVWVNSEVEWYAVWSHYMGKVIQKKSPRWVGWWYSYQLSTMATTLAVSFCMWLHIFLQEFQTHISKNHSLDKKKQWRNTTKCPLLYCSLDTRHCRPITKQATLVHIKHMQLEIIDTLNHE